MTTYKGTGIAFLRTLVRSHGPEKEAAFLARLSEQEREIFEKTLASTWVPLETASALLVHAAKVLYPGDVAGLRGVGAEMAKDTLSGIYRVVIKAFTVQMLMKQTARLWGTYHRKGRARASSIHRNRAQLIVEGYPDMPERFRECNAGFVHGAIEICGGREVTVAAKGDPDAWVWDCIWS